jgi:signal transduction histidine kinase
LIRVLRRGQARGRGARTSRQTGVHLALELAPDVDLVEGDERRLRQVVFNLLSNAVEVHPRGRARRRRFRPSRWRSARHRDRHGPGHFAREDRERIFEEFQQAGVSVEQRQGTGLGLALSRRLVELHCGRIWVESVLGRGSRFTCTLPIEEQSRNGR